MKMRGIKESPKAYEKTAKAVLKWMQEHEDEAFYKAAFADQSFAPAVTYNTFVRHWKEHEAASDVMEQVRMITEVRLIQRTLTGKYASAHFSIFLLKNWGEYVDKTEQKVDVTSTDTSFEFLAPGKGQ